MPSIFAHLLLDGRNADVTDHIFLFALAARKLTSSSRFTADKYPDPVHSLRASLVLDAPLTSFSLEPCSVCCRHPFPASNPFGKALRSARTLETGGLSSQQMSCGWERNVCGNKERFCIEGTRVCCRMCMCMGYKGYTCVLCLCVGCYGIGHGVHTYV